MLDIEALVEEATIKRFNARQDRKIAQEGYGATVGAVGVTESFCDCLSVVIDKHLLRLKSAPNDPLSPLGSLLSHLDPQRIAAASLRALLQAIAVGDKLARTTEAMGTTVHAECWAQDLLEADKDLYARVDRAVRRKHSAVTYRRQAARSIAGRAGYRGVNWSVSDRVKAGGLLLRCVLEALPEVFEIVTLDTCEMVPTITQGGLDIAEKAVEEALVRSPVFLPSTEPLAPWTGFRRGGYWDEGSRFSAPFVGARHKATIRAVKAAMGDGSMEPHIRGVNSLQAVPWVINRPILAAVKWAYENNIEVKGIPRKEDKALPKRLSDEEWEHDETRRRLHRRKIATIRAENLSFRGNRVLLAQDLQTAEMLGAEQFYTPLNCDWRGRLYSIPHFAFPRDDRVRALFLFARGMPIGEEGLWWLKVHVANCGDFDKISKRPLEERVEWTTTNLSLLERCARSPALTTPTWCNADKPFLFLAACMELTSAMATGSSYMTSLPISFDGSCSGLQHLCAMTRAPEAPLVNLTNTEVPGDIYQTVADLVRTRIAADTKASVDAADTSALAKLCLEYGITRNLVKRNVMTYAYSSKKFGMAQQHMEDLMRPLVFEVLEGKYSAHPFGEDEGKAAAKYLAGHIYDAIEQVVTTPATAMAFLQKCARVLASEGKPVSWTTPTGLPWSNRYHALNISRIRLWLADQPIHISSANGHKPQLDKNKCANGVSPNFVHALDAAHLLRTVNACVAEGIHDIATVHDSFGCLAPQATRFNQIIREQFVEMYEKHDVLQEVLDACKRDLSVHKWHKLPKVPERGPLDIKEVLNARYCFA